MRHLSTDVLFFYQQMFFVFNQQMFCLQDGVPTSACPAAQWAVAADAWPSGDATCIRAVAAGQGQPVRCVPDKTEITTPRPVHCGWGLIMENLPIPGRD